MLKSLKDLKYDRKVLLPRPKLTLIGRRCGNIACQKESEFKHFKENQYLCECGYMVEGEFELIKHAPKFGCSAKPCPHDKKKMDKGCLTCPFIIER